MSTTVNYTSKVAKTSTKCYACGTQIQVKVWYLKAKVKRNRVSSVVSIHDNEGVCQEVLEVSLGLKEAGFLSSRRPMYG